MSADRNRLFGLLALELNFITGEQLSAGLARCTQDSTQPLADVLQSTGAMSAADRQLLEPLVERQLAQHERDPDQALAALMAACLETSQHFARPDSLSLGATLSLSDSVLSKVRNERTAAIQSTASAGRFRVLRFHAAGGLGQVSVARDTELHRDVALKEIKPEYATQSTARGRFLLEAEVTGGLEHPGIVPVYSLGSYADGRPYYAMRFIQGDTFKQAIERYHDSEHAKQQTDSERVLELRELLGRFVDVCQAMEYAHSRGVLHRDLKPGNIMLGKYGETLVVDWGLAKVQGGKGGTPNGETTELPLQPASGGAVEATEMGQCIGTPQYMSPEQSQGDLAELGPATDIFSLGATLYFLLTGKTMYHAATKVDLLNHIALAIFPAPRAVLKTIPRHLEAICLKGLAAKPSERYSSAQELLQDVERYLADEPVAAYREPVTVRARRWARKHPGLVSGTLATVVVALFALLSGMFALGQMNRELARKEAVARAVTEFLLNDLLHLADPEAQVRARVQQDPDLKVQDVLQRAQARIQEKFAAEPAIVAQLQPLAQARVSRKLTLRALLLEAAKKVEGRFAETPETECMIRWVVGTSLQSIGEYAAAIPHLERSHRLYVQVYGPLFPLTLQSQANLAGAYLENGRLREAIALNEATLRLRKESLGADHLDTLTSMNNLANAYVAAGRAPEAIALYEHVLRKRQVLLGAEDSETLAASSNLASAYGDAGRLAEAIALGEQTLRVRQNTFGPEHPETLDSLNNLASVYVKARRFAEAVHLFQQTLEGRKLTFGPDHPDTIAAMHNLAIVLSDIGQRAEAIALYEGALEQFKSKLGPDHPTTLSAMNNLADVYAEEVRLQEAEQLFARVFQLRKEKLGAEHPHTLDSMNGLANTLLRLDRMDEALALQEEALRLKKARFGNDHPDTLLTMTNLGAVYFSLGRLDDARTMLEETLQLKLAKLGPDHHDTVRTRGLLGMTHQERKDWPAAEEQFLASWRATQNLAADLRAHFQPTLCQQLAQVYAAWGKPAEAARWEQERARITGKGDD